MISIDRAGAIERMGDEEIYKEIAAFFAQNIPENLQKLEEALDASPRVAECSPQELENPMRLAHSFKGNCATVGAEGVRDLAKELEMLCRAGKAAEARQAFALLKPQMLELMQNLK